MKKMVIIVMTLIMMFTMASCGNSGGKKSVTTSYHVSEAFEVDGTTWIPFTQTTTVDGEVVETVTGQTNDISRVLGMD